MIEAGGAFERLIVAGVTLAVVFTASAAPDQERVRLVPTIRPAHTEPTRCPYRYTACPEEKTRCPEIPTRCQVEDWTWCSQAAGGHPTTCPMNLTSCNPTDKWTACVNDPTICGTPTRCFVGPRTACPLEKGGGALQDPEESPLEDTTHRPTIYPLIWTRCERVMTHCPSSLTECPEEKTRCPEIQTQCAREPWTNCPPQTSSTFCPLDKTLCNPADRTACVQEMTLCGSPTVCQDRLRPVGCDVLPGRGEGIPPCPTRRSRERSRQ